MTKTPFRRRFICEAVALGIAIFATANSVQAEDKPTKKLDVQGLANLIDKHIEDRLSAEQIQTSPEAGDAEFLRRVYLDVLGVIPSAEKTEAFLTSKDPNKRAKLIDELLADPRFGKSFAEQWANLMLPVETNNRRLNREPFEKWLTAQFNDNKPLDKLAFDIINASGKQNENGAVTYYLANASVDKITDNVTKMFLGVQLQCAQCHDHPFVEWKQVEYWGMAQFFVNVTLTLNPNQAAKKGMSPGIYEKPPKPAKRGKRTRARRLRLPKEAKKVVASFLQDKTDLKLKADDERRPVLAKWITSPENPYFAKAMVNRFWDHMFGRGVVRQTDDMHDGNPPTHPELLENLTAQLKAADFDAKHLLRGILNSKTYQRTSMPVAGNKEDPELYSHRRIRVLSPEQLHDSLKAVLGKKVVRPQKGRRRPGTGPRDQFIAFFRTSENASLLDYQAGIPQALRLMNSRDMNTLAAAARIMGEVDSKKPEDIVTRIYLTALSRKPNAEELARLKTYVSQQDNPRNAYSDILWAVLNTSEFALNH